MLIAGWQHEGLGNLTMWRAVTVSARDVKNEPDVLFAAQVVAPKRLCYG